MSVIQCCIHRIVLVSDGNPAPTRPSFIYCLFSFTFSLEVFKIRKLGLDSFHSCGRVVSGENFLKKCSIQLFWWTLKDSSAAGIELKCFENSLHLKFHTLNCRMISHTPWQSHRSILSSVTNFYMKNVNIRFLTTSHRNVNEKKN